MLNPIEILKWLLTELLWKNTKNIKERSYVVKITRIGTKRKGQLRTKEKCLIIDSIL
jgi:hypothetical protein